MDTLEGVSSEDRSIVAKRMATRNQPKTTHVFLHDKGLKIIPKLKNPTQIIHAYFHNNNLTSIDNMDMLYNVTHLHLQWNKIASIKGLQTLCNLRKLYLGNNRIELVEGLEGLRSIEELRIEKQTGEEPLCFEPRSMTEIGATLRVIDVSDNRIEVISWVKPLRNLEVLIAKNNAMENFNDVADTLCPLMRLHSVELRGNPMCRKHRYKETLVARCTNLRTLDGADITNASRIFLRELDKVCRLRKMHVTNKLPETTEGVDDFFVLNMLEGQKARNARLHKKTSSESKEAPPPSRAIDASYTLDPRRLLPRARPSDAGQDAAPPAAAPLGLPRKGILKKPMPVKYV